MVIAVSFAKCNHTSTNIVILVIFLDDVLRVNYNVYLARRNPFTLFGLKSEID